MRKSLCLFGLFLVVGCASKKDDSEKRTSASIYQKAVELLKDEEYTEAAEEFKDLETLFPYSSVATEGQVLSAYCYFLAKDYLSAVREINIFLRYHPSNELVAYAMYLKAMCLYMQVSSIGRDAETALDAKKAFVELVNRFPNSIYYKDSMKKIMILDDITAAHEMLIGRFYQCRNNALAAIGRYNTVISQLSQTDFVPEALFRTLECCLSLGLKDEAKSAYEALKSSYSKTVWKEKASLLMQSK